MMAGQDGLGDAGEGGGAVRTAAEREAARAEREAARTKQGAARAEREAARVVHGAARTKQGAARTEREAAPTGREAARTERGGAAGGSRVGSRRRTLARGSALAAILIVGALVWFLFSVFQPFQGEGHGRVIVVIPPHTSASGIGAILERDGVIESGFFFDVRAMLDGKRSDLRAGRFLMKRGMSYEAAITALTTERPLIPETKVVIPEGETRREIAQTAAADGLRGSYMRASEHVSSFSAARYGAPRDIPNLEGFLFPATYEVPVHASVSTLVSDQLEAFEQRFGEEQVRRAHALKLTAYQLLIVASMIEREAKLPHDRPLIAAVIYNRLRLGMPLGIDATIRFAVDNYTKPLTEAQLHVRSPYNTRLHTGLPPTPISDPGMESIEAAAHPAKAGYLYYVNGADGCGDLVFSNTAAEFERNAAAYDAAVAANGGNPPVCKGR